MENTPDRITVSLHGQGPVTGIVHHQVETFLSIPYAATPVGGLRFAPPAPRPAWQQPLDCTQRGPVAWQTPSRMFGVLGDMGGETGEDCLTLCVWAPEGASAGAKLPVMFWIHGGAFLTGAGSQSWYDGANYAREQGVLLVSVNYRLGAFGYLAATGISAGNLGLFDQLAALEWTQRHIASFGGDPENVTVFGESAGAHATATLLACPASRGLFRRAILQSAPLSLPLLSADAADARARPFFDALAARGVARDLAALQAAPVELLLEAQAEAQRATQNAARGDVTPPFLPIDAAPMALAGRALWQAAADEAVARGVEVMIGWTRDEGALFLSMLPDHAALDQQALETMAEGLFGDEAAAAVAEAIERRQTRDPGALCDEIMTEGVFRRQSILMADAIAAQGGTVHVYRFDRQSAKPGLGACHCMDLRFTFGNGDAFASAEMLAGSDPAIDAALTAQMMTRWAAFARSGNPGVAPWSTSARPAMLLTDQGVAELADADLAHF